MRIRRGCSPPATIRSASGATREAEKSRNPTLFDVWQGDTAETFEDGWRNKLIWQVGILLGSVNSVYFCSNAFLPGYLTDAGRPDLIRNDGARRPKIFQRPLANLAEAIPSTAPPITLSTALCRPTSSRTASARPRAP